MLPFVTYVGTFQSVISVIHLEKGPMCQKDFNVKCTSCSSVIDVPRNANIVPGLPTLLTENETTTEASNQDPTNS